MRKPCLYIYLGCQHLLQQTGFRAFHVSFTTWCFSSGGDRKETKMYPITGVVQFISSSWNQLSWIISSLLIHCTLISLSLNTNATASLSLWMIYHSHKNLKLFNPWIAWFQREAAHRLQAAFPAMLMGPWIQAQQRNTKDNEKKSKDTENLQCDL